MTINYILYDGTWSGLLTAVFEIYERKLTEVRIDPQQKSESLLFAEELVVENDDKKAMRVWDGLSTKISLSARKNLFACFLSEIKGIENVILDYIRLVFAQNINIEKAFSFPAVLKLSQVGKMVHREKHRMEAFVRFKRTLDDFYFAVVEPDFNVLPLISSHFKNRYADQKWLIYDLKRKYGLYFDLKEVEEVTMDLKISDQDNLFEDSEALYQTLWQDYFKHINIESRKNTRLHLRHIPKRYWKHLTEK
ncbi:MAG: TIGR03915 family putative DNA repair protein [Daejeonella sp.]